MRKPGLACGHETAIWNLLSPGWFYYRLVFNTDGASIKAIMLLIEGSAHLGLPSVSLKGFTGWVWKWQLLRQRPRPVVTAFGTV